MSLLTRRSSFFPPKGTSVSTMPTQDIAGTNGATNFTWQIRNAEDFNTDIALGGIYPATTGSDLGLLNPACPAFAPYGASWKVKANGPDTSGVGSYSAIDTMSISNSILTIHDHIDGVKGPLGSAVKLLNQSAGDTNYLTYGRGAVRWRGVADPILGGRSTGTNWGCVALMISDPAHFPIWSEMDWLETGINSLNPGGFWHPGGDTINNSIAKAGIGVPFSEWHTTVIEWMPDPAGARIRWYDNGILCFETTTDTPVSPAKLGWLIQTASEGGVPTGDGYLQIDWMCMWDYV